MRVQFRYRRALSQTRREIVAAGTFSDPCVFDAAAVPRPGGGVGRRRGALDGAAARPHGAAMQVARNRFFGICREIIRA